jgi:hypothetical protein
MYNGGKEGTMTLRTWCFHSIHGAIRQWIIDKRTHSDAEKLVPVHLAEGMMERMIILHGMIVEMAENHPRNGLNRLRWNDIVEKAMIEHDGDVNAKGQIGLKVSQIQGGGQKNQFPDCSGVPAGVDSRHESAVTGPDEDQIGLVLKEAIQSVHPPIERTGKVLKDHVWEFIPEKFAFCTTTCALKAVNKDTCRRHDCHLSADTFEKWLRRRSKSFSLEI